MENGHHGTNGEVVHHPVVPANNSADGNATVHLQVTVATLALETIWRQSRVTLYPVGKVRAHLSKHCLNFSKYNQFIVHFMHIYVRRCPQKFYRHGNILFQDYLKDPLNGRTNHFRYVPKILGEIVFPHFSGCEDVQQWASTCPAWKRYCRARKSSSQYVFMSINCKKTCELCDSKPSNYSSYMYEGFYGLE